MGGEDPEKRAQLRERRYEREYLMREKRSEDAEAFEEVFDRSTLSIIYKMLNRGELTRIYGVVDAGKESRIYLGQSPKGKVALKIYLVTTAEFRKGRAAYIDGDPRFSRVRRDTRSLVYLWAQKEFTNLQACRLAGVPAPRPILVRGNVLMMQFIGSGSGKTHAPLMKNVELDKPVTIYRSLLAIMRKLYQAAHLVHGDLSEYNVMIWRGKPVIFDISQGVSIEHPMADVLLKRDISNVNKYFEHYPMKLQSAESIYNVVVGTVAV